MGSILQISDKKARVALGAGVNVVAGTMAAGAGTGLIGSFGVASTGTAIASLAGAAKSTATLYWIGGLVGGGVAAGGLVLAAGGAGAGYLAARKMRSAVFGSARGETEISEEEQRLLETIAALKSAISQATLEDRDVSTDELSLFFEIGVNPLVRHLQKALEVGVFDRLTHYNRIRLRGQVHVLRGYLEASGDTL
ncbi:hypothetical protein R3X27_04930 [Tropicimonas sp. TH_r6]|uniref:hypothetical protein n=1 Tax=Tropicimonas sp. TH_r6 TaxID=3082085 RepID=UPI002953DEA2|nr:hypothetical protein [Tropicimonas sp. TH_r6]MDV7142022.1 hypothetical protein [Tropicimonas sp. TH_r6]